MAAPRHRFYPDRLEFDEGFFSINRKAIKFQDVKEVTLRKGVLQRIYGLGKIYHATLATGATSGIIPFSALGLWQCLRQRREWVRRRKSRAVFRKIRTIVNARS